MHVFPKKITSDQGVHETTISIISHQGNANHQHCETPLSTHGMAVLIRPIITSFGEAVGIGTFVHLLAMQNVEAVLEGNLTVPQKIEDKLYITQQSHS